ncbi:MAG: Gfo/Idh/MocA family oxidoreductase [Rhodospirillales bacterium]|nr:Gfo/Idh/MocA family oxidoreductase [Rhodospirillales bacterium]
MQPLKVAIIGCGWVAGTQAREGFGALANLFELVACCDSVAERAQAFAAEHGIPHWKTDLDAVLAMPDIDVVSICTPPMLHHAMAISVLAAGKHAICEKPFTSSLALLDDIRAAEARSRGRIMPIFQYRFGQGIWNIRHLIHSGLLGKLYVSSAETAWRRGPDYYRVPWRGKFASELGGVLLTQSIHIHDLLLWLIGPVRAVSAFKTTRVNPVEVEDCAVASLQLADGSLASLTATLGSVRPATRLRLCFENAVIERMAYDSDAIRPGQEPWTVTPRDESLGAQLAAQMRGASQIGSGFAGQFALFHQALREGLPFPVTLDDARASLELITAIFRAQETGAVVHLPIDAASPGYDGWVPSAR